MQQKVEELRACAHNVNELCERKRGYMHKQIPVGYVKEGTHEQTNTRVCERTRGYKRYWRGNGKVEGIRTQTNNVSGAGKRKKGNTCVNK